MGEEYFVFRTWAVTVVSPLEMIRTKMQSQKMTMSQVNIHTQKTFNIQICSKYMIAIGIGHRVA